MERTEQITMGLLDNSSVRTDDFFLRVFDVADLKRVSNPEGRIGPSVLGKTAHALVEQYRARKLATEIPEWEYERREHKTELEAVYRTVHREDAMFAESIVDGLSGWLDSEDTGNGTSVRAYRRGGHRLTLTRDQSGRVIDRKESWSDD